MINLFQQNQHLIQKLQFIENYLKEKRKGMMTNSDNSVGIIYSFRGGLKQIVTNIEEQVRRDSGRSSPHSYSRSYQRTHDSEGKRISMHLLCCLLHVAWSYSSNKNIYIVVNCYCIVFYLIKIKRIYL